MTDRFSYSCNGKILAERNSNLASSVHVRDRVVDICSARR